MAEEETKRTKKTESSLLDAWTNDNDEEVGSKRPVGKKVQENTERLIEDVEKVYVMLSVKDKLFCKSKARELYKKGIINGLKYSDYIEYLIKREQKK